MLLDLGIMINTRKRGPKPSGVVKEVFYARVEPRVKHQLEEFLGNISLGCAGTDAKTEDKGVSRASDGLGVSGQWGVDQKAVESKLEASTDKSEVRRLFDSVGVLSEENEGLKKELEVARMDTVDGRLAWAHAEIRKLKEQLKASADYSQ